MNAKRHSSWPALVTLILIGCSGGGGTTVVPNNPPTGGIQGSGIAFGGITGFGSIFVNGVEFSTSGAQIRIEDQPGTESQLRIGQVVLVRGSIASSGLTGSATQVSFNDNVEGPIANLDVAAGTFVVLGQTVRVTGATLFDSSISPASIEGLSNGLVVEVSGFPNATGEISATRIEGKAAGGQLELTGTVSNFNAAASTFQINALVVDFSAATIRNGTLENGRLVEVKGTTFTAGGALRATEVEVRAGLGAQSGDLGELEGLVTRFVSNSDFDIGGQRIATDASTQFITNGLTLGLNVKVEAEGTFNAAGVLLARKVELKRDASSRVVSTIDSLDAVAGTFRLDIGVTVSVNAATQLEDKLDQPVRPFRFSDLRAGDYVEVRGFEASTGNTLVAVVLERERPEDRVELRGTARNVADPNVTILGVNNALVGSVEFRDAADAPITRAEFFTRAAASEAVKLSGRVAGGVVTWEEAELED